MVWLEVLLVVFLYYCFLILNSNLRSKNNKNFKFSQKFKIKCLLLSLFIEFWNLKKKKKKLSMKFIELTIVFLQFKIKKKRSLFKRSLIGFTKTSVSLFPLFNKTSPTHNHNLHQIFLFRELGWVLLLICFIWYSQLLYLNCNKNALMFSIRAFSDW